MQNARVVSGCTCCISYGVRSLIGLLKVIGIAGAGQRCGLVHRQV